MGVKSNASDQLMLLARQITQTTATDALSDDVPYDMMMNRLATLVARYLDWDADRVIERAIQRLDRSHAHDAAELIAFVAEEAAATVRVPMHSNHPSVPSALVKQRIVLVPLVLVQPLGDVIPTTIPDTALNAFIRSVEHGELLSPHIPFVLAPTLYTENDLPISGSDQRRLVKSVFDQRNSVPA